MLGGTKPGTPTLPNPNADGTFIFALSPFDNNATPSFNPLGTCSAPIRNLNGFFLALDVSNIIKK